jgi:rhodanese/phosphatase family protein
VASGGRPFPRSYWAHERKVLAGCYPGDLDGDAAEAKARALLEVGVRTFVNLMEDEELDHSGRPFEPYAPVFVRVAAELGLELSFHRYPIPDLGVPGTQDMTRILKTISESVGRGCPVYVHCWGGRGRTGTVIGCHLIQQGLATPDDFVEVIQELRKLDSSGGNSPETSEQIEFVKRYST